MTDESRTRATLKYDWRWLLPIGLLLLFVFAYPVGYIGGGADDSKYISAAQCWNQFGACLPTNHWEGRWPVVAPLAASVTAFGLSRFSLALPFVLASFACLYLLKILGDRHLNMGLAGALTFGLLPVFSTEATSATVAPIELLFILAAFTVRAPILCGILLGVAFQVRETAIAAVPIALATHWRHWKVMGMVSAGWAAPLIVEFAFFYLTTGNPIYRRTLSVGHTLIPSSELAVMDKRPPFFNSGLLRHWNYEPGIRIHWLVDGFVNLFANLKTGLLFVLAPALAWLYRMKLTQPQRRAALFIALAAYFYAAVQIYVLAIDPKPRMMYVPLAGLSLVMGAVLVRAWNAVTLATVVAIVPLMAVALMAQPRQSYWERHGELLAARYSGQVSVPQVGYFLFGKLKNLPENGRRYVMIVKRFECNRRSPEDYFDPKAVAVAAERGAGPLPEALGSKWRLCLFDLQPQAARAASLETQSEERDRRSYRNGVRER